MLIHIVPKMHVHEYKRFDVQLLSISIPEIGWRRDGRDLRVGHPYPNRSYFVGYITDAAHKKAVLGLIVKTNKVSRYTVIEEWSVNDLVVTHTVEHTVLDASFDAVSDAMLLWYGNDQWPSRFPDDYPYRPPVMLEPTMDIFPAKENGTMRCENVQDTFNKNGIIIQRLETFRLPTIERERLDTTNLAAFSINKMPEHILADTVVSV